METLWEFSTNRANIARNVPMADWIKPAGSDDAMDSNTDCSISRTSPNNSVRILVSDERSGRMNNWLIWIEWTEQKSSLREKQRSINQAQVFGTSAISECLKLGRGINWTQISVAVLTSVISKELDQRHRAWKNFVEGLRNDAFRRFRLKWSW